MLQALSLTIFLVLSAVAVGAFFLAFRSTNRPADVPYEEVAGMRTKLFVVLGLALAAFLGFTLPLMPYAHAGQAPDRIVHVRARQFLFEFSDQAFPPGDAMVAGTLTPIKAGELVEYRVTATDATHGFGVYDLKGRLIAQTQAMPGYVNRLRVRFPAPGIYPVLCMEYCGVSHHVMQSGISVLPQ